MRKGLTILWMLAALCACFFLGQSQAQALAGELAALPRLTAEEIRSLPSPQGPVELLLDGAPLPYDVASHTYYIPQSDQTDAFSGNIQINRQPGMQYSFYAPPGVDKITALKEGAVFQIFAQSEDTCLASNIVFTNLPLLSLTTASNELPVSEDGLGEIQILSFTQGRLMLESSRMEINLRGNTSKRFPKKSYRVKIIDHRGEGKALAIAGLRQDDDWILNPLYTDRTKIREALSYALWAQMNSSGAVASSSRLAYAEVLLNGEYWGLYGVQERVDRKQVDGDKRSGILYKIIANDRPEAQELLACESTEVCRGFEISFQGAGVTAPWAPAAAYMEALDGNFAHPFAQLSMDNVIDYGLWAMLTQAHDCHFKNQFIHCVYRNGRYTFYKIPWDLNNTWGDVWQNELPENNHTQFFIGKPVLDSAFEAYLSAGDASFLDAVQARWAQLRAHTLTEERITTAARSLHASIQAALHRDTARWPACGSGKGNAENITELLYYTQQILPRMDAYIATLGMPETEKE